MAHAVHASEGSYCQISGWKWLHKAPAAAAGPEARWRRREFSAASSDSATNSLLALAAR